MFKKLIITIISVLLLTVNVNAGSDGELTLKTENESKEVKDCFEKLNRITFAFNQGLDKAIIKPIAKDIEIYQTPFKVVLVMQLIIYLTL